MPPVDPVSPKTTSNWGTVTAKAHATVHQINASPKRRFNVRSPVNSHRSIVDMDGYTTSGVDNKTTHAYANFTMLRYLYPFCWKLVSRLPAMDSPNAMYAKKPTI